MKLWVVVKLGFRDCYAHLKIKEKENQPNVGGLDFDLTKK